MWCSTDGGRWLLGGWAATTALSEVIPGEEERRVGRWRAGQGRGPLLIPQLYDAPAVWLQLGSAHLASSSEITAACGSTSWRLAGVIPLFWRALIPWTLTSKPSCHVRSRMPPQGEVCCDLLLAVLAL